MTSKSVVIIIIILFVMMENLSSIDTSSMKGKFSTTINVIYFYNWIWFFFEKLVFFTIQGVSNIAKFKLNNLFLILEICLSKSANLAFGYMKECFELMIELSNDMSSVIISKVSYLIQEETGNRLRKSTRFLKLLKISRQLKWARVESWFFKVSTIWFVYRLFFYNALQILIL